MFYYANGGNKTIDSFYDGRYAYKYLPSRHEAYIKKNFEEDIAFLRGLADFFEWGDFVCVHAGADLSASDWRERGERNFRWIRQPFHAGKNETGKTFVFGHLARMLNADKSNGVWVSPCGTKIGINGGAVFSGLLHGLVIGEGELFAYSADNAGNVSNAAMKTNDFS